MGTRWKKNTILDRSIALIMDKRAPGKIKTRQIKPTVMVGLL